MKRFLTLAGATVLSLGSPELIVGTIVIGGTTYMVYRFGRKLVARYGKESIEIEVPADATVTVGVPMGDPDYIPVGDNK